MARSKYQFHFFPIFPKHNFIPKTWEHTCVNWHHVCVRYVLDTDTVLTHLRPCLVRVELKKYF